jgi:hypothetical protein
LLESVAAFLNVQAEWTAMKHIRFQVNENATGIEYHYRHEGEVWVIDAPVTLQGDEIHIRISRNEYAYFKKDLLDPTNPIWNN